MHHLHISVLTAVVVYLLWLVVRLPLMLLAHRFHRHPLAQAFLQLG